MDYTISEYEFKNIMREMCDEEITADKVISLSEVIFSQDVETLSLSITKNKIIMYVNLSFINNNCQTESHIKALIYHELLHIVFNDTLLSSLDTREHEINNIALDASINAIIHKKFGDKYSSFMSIFYKDTEPYFLNILRKPEMEDKIKYENDKIFLNLWNGIYSGTVTVQNIKDFLKDRISISGGIPKIILIGGPFVLGLPISGRKTNLNIVTEESSVSDSSKTMDKAGKNNEEKMSKIITDAFKKIIEDNDLSKTMDKKGKGNKPMNKEGENDKKNISKIITDALKNFIENNASFNNYNARDAGYSDELVEIYDKGKESKEEWKSKTEKLIRKLLTPHKNIIKNKKKELVSLSPVLSSNDRRAIIKSIWMPTIPFSNNIYEQNKESQFTDVYLDVSGSVSLELPLLIDVLNSMNDLIKKPFMAFSNKVDKAVIRYNRLYTSSTGGTDINCVLDDISKKKQKSVLIISDGYFLETKKELIEKTKKTKKFALILPNGNDKMFKEANIKTFWLEKFK
ncbi:MAG: hypothetical protein GX445_06755 [Elusimicrobia bacterium]|nr:hypothetical protein [Elusimicrobiota bacterium]